MSIRAKLFIFFGAITFLYLALVIVISEQTGKIVYVKNGEFFSFKTTTALKETLAQDISE